MYTWIIQGNKRQKSIGYSGNLPHCPAKRKTAKSIATTTVKSSFHLQLYASKKKKKRYILLTAFVYTALWRRKPSAISAAKQWEWIRKAIRATFSHKDIKIKAMHLDTLLAPSQRYQICEPFGKSFCIDSWRDRTASLWTFNSSPPFK